MPQTQKRDRSKKQIVGMLPTKQFLSKTEAMAYTDLSINAFEEFVVNNNVRVSCINKKTYYKATDIDRAFEKNIIINFKN